MEFFLNLKHDFLLSISGADTESLASVPSISSTTSTTNSVPVRHTIDQLALNMGFGGIKPTLSTTSSNLSPTGSIPSSASLINSGNLTFQPVTTPTSSIPKFEFNDNISLNTDISNDTENEVKERVITKIDPIDMTAKSTVVTVPKDSVRRAAMLLAGPKFQLNYNEIPKEKLAINTDTIYSTAVSSINFIKSNKSNLIYLDCCWSYFINICIMETNFIIFFWFNGWNTICCGTILYVCSNIY